MEGDHKGEQPNSSLKLINTQNIDLQNELHLIKPNQHHLNRSLTLKEVQQRLPDKVKRKLMSRVSFHQVPLYRSQSATMDNFQKILQNNSIWSATNIQMDPDYYAKMVNGQQPQYLWIGCSDSRVPANQIVGLGSGQLFVHRNIANQAPLSDINCLAVIQYSVQVLKVKDIIVCGHYGCGGIRAAFTKHDHGPLEAWLSHIRDIRARYRKQLTHLTQQENQKILVQLNVKQQVYNVARIPIVQKAWAEGRQLRIHGLVYQLQDGLLNDLGLTIHNSDKLPQEYKIY